MAIMTATAVGFFGEPFFLGTACAVILFRAWGFLAISRVNIQRAKLLTALPAPRATTAGSYLKGACRLQATCEDIVTRRIF